MDFVKQPGNEKAIALMPELDKSRATLYPIKSMLKMSKSRARFGSPVGIRSFKIMKEFKHDLRLEAKEFLPFVHDDLTLDGSCQEGRLYATSGEDDSVPSQVRTKDGAS